MAKLNYEKQNAIRTLKNEIKGLNNLIDTLELLLELDYKEVDGKIINVKLERYVNDKVIDHIRVKEVYKDQVFYIMLKDHFNKDTNSYIDYYKDIDVKIATNITYNDDMKEQIRFDARETKKNINELADILVKRMLKLEDELANINQIMKDIEKLYKEVADFKHGKSAFLINEIPSIRSFI